MAMLFDGKAGEFGERNKRNEVSASCTDIDDEKKVGKQ